MPKSDILIMLSYFKKILPVLIYIKLSGQKIRIIIICFIPESIHNYITMVTEIIFEKSSYFGLFIFCQVYFAFIFIFQKQKYIVINQA